MGVCEQWWWMDAVEFGYFNLIEKTCVIESVSEEE